MTQKMLIILFFASIGCHSGEKISVLKLPEEPGAAQSEILRVVAGKPLAEARRIMEENGFRCSTLTNGKGDTELYCDKHTPEKFPVSRRWQVVLTQENGVVKDATVTVGLVGP